MLVKRDEISKKAVITLLQRINDTMATKGTRFLTGETLCCFDTELMPKLQHIRVAGKFFVGFEIPESMTHLWSYIREMYQLDAFTQSCPADQVHMHLNFINLLSLQSEVTVLLCLIKEKEDAWRQYQDAVTKGKTAGK